MGAFFAEYAVGVKRADHKAAFCRSGLRILLRFLLLKNPFHHAVRESPYTLYRNLLDHFR